MCIKGKNTGTCKPLVSWILLFSIGSAFSEKSQRVNIFSFAVVFNTWYCSVKSALDSMKTNACLLIELYLQIRQWQIWPTDSRALTAFFFFLNIVLIYLRKRLRTQVEMEVFPLFCHPVVMWPTHWSWEAFHHHHPTPNLLSSSLLRGHPTLLLSELPH